MAVVRKVRQVQLHAVGDPLALHRVHLVQVAGRDQGHLKGTVQIKVRQQVPRIQVLRLRLLNSVDQR